MKFPLIETDARSYLELSGFKVIHTFEIVNPYWGYRLNDDKQPVAGSGWLLLTEHGLISIAWRKRVMEVEWGATALRKEVRYNGTATTTGLYYFHAYDVPELIARLQELRANFLELERGY